MRTTVNPGDEHRWPALFGKGHLSLISCSHLYGRVNGRVNLPGVPPPGKTSSVHQDLWLERLLSVIAMNFHPQVLGGKLVPLYERVNLGFRCYPFPLILEPKANLKSSKVT